MTYKILIISILLIPSWAHGQLITIKGKVNDKLKQPLEYVSIGIIDKPIGTVSDKTGNFILYLNKDLLTTTDSLKFSMIGFNSKAITLNQIINENGVEQLSVELEEKFEKIEEVVISANRLKSKEIGSEGYSLMNMYVNFSMSEYPNQNLGSEIGRKFSIRNKNTQLKAFRFFIGHNNFDTVKFRFNVYSIKRLRPDINILKNNVFFELKNKKTGWIDVDLSSYNIVVNDDIIVSIEWVSKSSIGNQLTLPIIMPTTHVHFYKFGSQNKWKRFNSMTTLMELTIKY